MINPLPPRRRLRAAAFWLPALLALTGEVRSQPPPTPGPPHPRLHVLAPNGAKPGTSFELTLSGLDLDGASDLLFSVPGCKSELVSAPPPSSAPDMRRPGGRRGGGALVSARFKVTVPAEAPPGIHDVRLVSRWGVSNPRAFVVGDQQEIEEKEPNNDVAEAQRVPLGCAVTGVIATPTDVDYYFFEGKKGQRVVVSCLTSSIDSRLQPELQLYARAGGQLASNRAYSENDALVDATLPADGEYLVRVSSFTYTEGTPEHFYRLTISTAPWIDAVMPPTVEPGKEAKVTVYGRNLPGGKLDPSAVLDGRVLEKVVVTVKAPADPKAAQRLAYTGFIPPRSSGLDGFELRLKNAAGVSNPFLLTYAAAPVVLDNEKNDTPETAQEVKVPCEIAGWVEKVRDRDWYRFSVKKGETYTIEAFGDRIGAPLDLYFTLRQAGGKGGAQEFDDNPDILHQTQFYTRSDDPQRYKLTATEDATYLLQVSSRESDNQAGPRHQYKLRIAAEKPEFRLIALPTTTYAPEGVVLRAGAAQAYNVLVWRNDGFAGEVTLSADGLPKGVTCPPQVVGPQQKQGTLVLLAEADAPPWTGTITIKGTATVDGKIIETEARAADVTWSVGQQQQNVPALSRVSRDLVLAVREAAPYHLVATTDKTEVASGDKVTVNLKLARLSPDFKTGSVQVTAMNFVQGGGQQRDQVATFNNNQPLTLNKDDGTLSLDLRRGLAPGTYTFVFRVSATVPIARDPASMTKSSALITQVTTPVTVTVKGR